MTSPDSDKSLHDTEHQSLIKTPRQLITVVVLSFVIPIFIIILIAILVTSDYRDMGAASSQAATLKRIAPIATVAVRDPNQPRTYLTGAALFQQVCVSCHAAPGIPGAPKVGDIKAWAPLIKEGAQELLKEVIKGKGAMPPRAGTSPDEVSDYEILRSVVYMMNSSGGKVPEPTPPPAVATAPAPTAQNAKK